MVDATKRTCGQRMSAIGRFIYDSEKHTVLGRTPKSWFLITVFYLIYYSLLAGFFIGMLSVLLFGIIEEHRPMLTGQQSLIRMNPGLGFRPMPDVERTLIKVNVSDPSSLKPYIANLETLYNKYSSVNATYQSHKIEYAKCNLSDAQANREFDPTKKICQLNPAVEWGKNCTPENYFGYTTGQPCVIIKMNRIFGWLPEVKDPALSNHTLLRCEAENEGDKVTFGYEEPEYSPGVVINGTRYGYFSSALFPFLSQPGYTTPAVAVRFPKVRRNVLVMIQCVFVNLANSVYSKVDRDGMVRFELLIVDKS